MKKKSWITTLILVVILILAICFIYIQKRNDNISSGQQQVSDNSMIDWVPAPKNGEFKQPEGLGVERQITDDNAEKKAMASLNVSGGSNKNPLMLAIDDDDVKEAAESLVEVVDKGKYRCAIDWSDYDISDSDYFVLLSLIGQMYEDKLNENSTRYSVIVKAPTVEQLEEAGIPVMLDIDADGYLTMYCDITTQDLVSKTEVEEILAFTVYYEGDILAFKE